MKLKLTMKPTAQILEKRGLEQNGAAQEKFTELCKTYMDKYTPVDSGVLKGTKSAITDPSTIHYDGPYAHYQYTGKVYVFPKKEDRPPQKEEHKEGEKKRSPLFGLKKIKTKTKLTYHGEATRGPRWDRRMWKAEGKEILKELTKTTGGKPGK
jgi:hypothetical protein